MSAGVQAIEAGSWLHEHRLSRVSLVGIAVVVSFSILGSSLLQGCGAASDLASEESEEVIVQRPDLSAALGPGRYRSIDPSELFTQMAAELEGKEGVTLEAAIQAELCRAAVDFGALGLLHSNNRALETLDTGVPPESERERCRRALLGARPMGETWRRRSAPSNPPGS